MGLKCYSISHDRVGQEKAAPGGSCPTATPGRDHVTTPVEPPGHIDATIRCIQAECAIRASPLDAILAKIAHENIAHDAPAPPMATLPPPAAMLSTSPCPTFYVGAVLATMGGSAPSVLPLPTLNSQLRTVRQRAQPCCCTGRHNHPQAPSPPDMVLPSLPQPMLGGIPKPTTANTMLAQATSPCCSEVSSPTVSSMTASTPSLHPFASGTTGNVYFGGGAAHLFCVCGMTLTSWKCTQCKHCPCYVCLCHGPQAPDLQELLLCGQQHWPCTPNQSTPLGWA
jgi:hypothetical protein